MSGTIKFTPLNIESCFSNNYYIVPDYQREYVWEEKEVSQLMNDIFDEYEEDSSKEYFIGSTVTLDRGESLFDLIDGQQRTTTIFLMLCAFRKQYKKYGYSTQIIEQRLRNNTLNSNGDEITKNRLELQYMESNEIISTIIDEKKPSSKLSPSGKRIFEAIEIIEDFLNDRFGDDPDKIKKFFHYCFTKVRFIQIETDDVSRALKIFETINERGIGLNSMDLLKNLLFRKVEIKQFPAIKKEWEVMIRTLESNKEKQLRFLRYFITANYDIESWRSAEIVREDEIYTWFSAQNNLSKWSEDGDYFKFLRKLQRNAETFVEFVNGRSDGKNNYGLENLRYLGGSTFRQHMILLLAVRDMESSLFNHFIKQLESLIFVYLVTRENSRNFEPLFGLWAKKLRKVSTKETLNQFIEECMMPEVDSRMIKFDNAFMGLSMKGIPIFRTKYTLAKFAQYIDLERKGSKNLKSLSEYYDDGIEIEHILPRNPTPEFKSTFGAEYDEYSMRLGNLTLLEKSINSSIGRGEFSTTKISAYSKSSIYLTRSIAKIDDVGENTSVNRMNEKLKEFTNWGFLEIDERQTMLKNIAKQIWKIELFRE